MGVNATIGLSDKFALSTRIAYVDREDFKWRIQCLCPEYLFTTFDQQELLADINVLYQVKSLDLGLGTSIIKKLGTSIGRHEVSGVYLSYRNNTYFGLHTLLTFHYQRWFVKLMYLRWFKPEELLFFATKGIHRADLTIGYKLFQSRRR